MDLGLEIFESFAGGIINNDLFFYTFPDCNLVKMNLESGEVIWINNNHNFDDLPNYLTINANKVFRCGNKGNLLTCYDLKREKEYFFEFNVKSGTGTNILNMFSFQNLVFIVPKYEKKIIIYDVIKKIFIEKGYHDIVENLELSDCIKEGDRVWIWGKDKSEIVIFEMKKMEFQKIELQENLRIKYISINSGRIVFLTDNNDVYNYNIETNNLTLIWECFDISMDFDRIHLVGEDGKLIILLPSINYNEIILLENGETKIYNEYPDKFEYIFPQQHKYVRYAESSEQYVYPMRSANYCLRINKCDGKIDWVQPRISRDTIYKVLVEAGVVKESKISTLDGFLNIL